MPVNSKSKTTAAKKPLTPKQRKQKNLKTERSLGIGLSLLAALLGGGGICAILLFGFQNGLPVTERCHCSWEKVIIFSIASFVVIAAQLIGYGIYYGQCRHNADITNPRLKQQFEKKRLPRVFGYTALIAVPFTLTAFLLLPLIADQNHNFLWFFRSGMGVLCVVITFLVSALVGIFSKLMFTQEVSSR